MQFSSSPLGREFHADLDAERDLARDEPSDEELWGACPDPETDRPEGCEDWFSGLDEPASGESQNRSGFAEAEFLDACGPCAALAGSAQQALDDGLGELPDNDLVGVLRAAQRLEAWQAGIQLAAVAELDARRLRQAGRPGSSRASEQISAELAAAMVLTGRSADLLLGLARDLARLPHVRRALIDGRIDRARAAVFAAELAGLGDVAAAAVGMGFADVAGSMTTGQLRAALRSMVLSVDPAAARRRAERGRADTRVESWQEGSGNVGLAGRELPPADAIAADRRLTAIARTLKDAGAPGTLDQLRAAVFTALLAGRDPETLLPEGSSSTARNDGLAALSGTVHLVMPATAWLGLTDAPGEAAGLGPLGAWTCRDLADRLAAGTDRTRWSVTLTGQDGRAVAHAEGRAGPGGLPRDRAGPCGLLHDRAGPAPNPRSQDRGLSWLASLRFDWLERNACGHSRQVAGYHPPDRLCNLVRARQRTCSFPGCRRPAQDCDLDHSVPWDQGGRSCECNLSPLCRRHHRVKQAPGWQLTQDEPGVMVWRLPSGRTYQTAGDPYPV